VSAQARLWVGSVALAAVALVLWKFVSAPGEAPTRKSLDTDLPAIQTPQPATPAPVPRVPAPAAPKETDSAESPAVENVAHANTLNERTLIGTKWEREGFGLEFGADSKLLIGGRERAQWQIIDSRIRLYRDTTGEEHWLEIAGDKLMWEGQEIGRVP
jgi:hypothetical protein